MMYTQVHPGRWTSQVADLCEMKTCCCGSGNMGKEKNVYLVIPQHNLKSVTNGFGHIAGRYWVPVSIPDPS